MKILVIRFSSLGDVILTTAILPNLKRHWPEAEITFLTKVTTAPVFDNNPHVDHVRIYDPERQSFSKLADELRQEKYDVVIDLHSNTRSWFTRLLVGAPLTVAVEKATLARRAVVIFKWVAPTLKRSVRDRILDTLKEIDVPVISRDTELFPKNVDAVLLSHGIPPSTRLIGVAPGAKHNTKRWPAARFAEAANRLAAVPGSMVVIVGDKSDRAVAEQVSGLVSAPCKNLTGWTSLRELIAIVSKFSLLLTNDSGLMHMAEALKIPLVALFGPTVRAFGFAPYRSTSRVAEVVNLKCRPCTLHGDERCPLGHHRCMEDLDLNAVLFVASDVLEQRESAGKAP